jgi:hypothetical protein
MTSLRLIALTGICAALIAAQKPSPALPAEVLAAKKVFLLRGRGAGLAFDTVYAAFQQWPRYTLVDNVSGADIMIVVMIPVDEWRARSAALQTMPPEIPPSSHGSESRSVSSFPQVPRDVVVTILDAQSKEALWSTVERCRAAITRRNRDKETINATERVIADLKARAGQN